MIMGKIRVLSRMRWVAFVLGLLVGALLILGIRLATYHPEQIHYHANFAVFINGQQELFKGPQYYQEVAVCTADKLHLPEQRTHMHEDVNSVVHVHDHVVTWGQFFENLGWVVGPDFIVKSDGSKYFADATNKLHILLNGQDYTDLSPINNMVIKDKDRLLVSYGNRDASQLQQQYKAVPATAAKYDSSQDPASCAGSHSASFEDRLHHLF